MVLRNALRSLGFFLTVISISFLLGALLVDFIGKSMINPARMTWGIYVDITGSASLFFGWILMKKFGTEERYVVPVAKEVIKIAIVIAGKLCWLVFAYSDLLFNGLGLLSVELVLGYIASIISTAILLWPTESASNPKKAR